MSIIVNMIDEDDARTVNGRVMYSCYCDECGVHVGYKRISDHDKWSKLCRSCSQRRAKGISEHEREKYPNVDFDDYRNIPYNKVKSKGSGFKKHYRVTCLYCGRDKGYVRKSLYSTRCRNCSMTDDVRRDISAKVRGVDLDEWDGYSSPDNTRIRRSKQGRDWRAEVFKRANYTCDITGRRGGSLHAHHIESFSTNENLRFDPDNGVCILEELHLEFHSKYGKKNNTREQYEEFKKAKRNELGLLGD